MDNKITPTTLLAIVFIILKLTKVIEWSWFWVLSPLWISVLFFVLGGLILGIIKGYKETKGKQDKTKIEGWQKTLREKYTD